MNSLHWFQGAGTDEQVLTEILASRTPAEIRNIKQVYQEGNCWLWECGMFLGWTICGSLDVLANFLNTICSVQG